MRRFYVNTQGTLMAAVAALVLGWMNLGSATLQAAENSNPAASAPQGQSDAKAKDLPNTRPREEHLRVGGEYRIEKISRESDDQFLVLFQAVHPSGEFDSLDFSTRTLHAGIYEGQIVKMSADVIRTQGQNATVAQIVIFVKTKEGETPIWMLSHRLNPQSGAAMLQDFLKLHAPQSDFLIF